MRGSTLHTRLVESANRIHAYLRAHHLRDSLLIGPDPGVRFNYRFWRFLKSYAPRINWRDDLCYMQTQGYWILSNWEWADLNANSESGAAAVAASMRVLELQRKDGAWDYPNPEWRGRVATVEGVWASLGLLESYRRSGDQRFLDAVLRWHEFLEEQIGFKEFGGNIAVNYFMNSKAALNNKAVPNNTALALRYLAKLYEATSDKTYLERCHGLVTFLRTAQQSTGELPYQYRDPRYAHFQCYQYHAFMYLDLLEYLRVTRDEQVIEILKGVYGFLRGGISPSGFAYYQCGGRRRTVNYHTVAIAAALAHPCGRSRIDDSGLVERALQYFLRQQRSDGSVPHSTGDYGVLRDNRVYPRYLSMITYHLLLISRQDFLRSRRQEMRDLTFASQSPASKSGELVATVRPGVQC